MFFRRKITPSGQVLQLLEAYRTEAGDPRQHVVVSLGNANIPEPEQSIIAKAITAHLYGRIDLFYSHYSETVQGWIDFIKRKIAAKESGDSIAGEKVVESVLIDHVEHAITSELGPELVGLHAWHKIGMDEHLRSVGFNELQIKRAAVSIINRLVDPVSEHRLEQWLPRTALPELLGEDILGLGDDCYYRISDKLLSHQDSIESCLRERQGMLFNLDRTLLLYDLTNTHFEGIIRRNPKALRGKNKQKRDDCVQLVVGMVFDRDGFSLAHRVFEGTKSDSKSLVDMIASLEEAVGKKDPQLCAPYCKPLVILDGGIATARNLSLLRKQGFSYLVNDNRRSRGTFEKEFNEDEKFELIEDREKKPGVFVRLLEQDTGKSAEQEGFGDRLVLCKSSARGEKERAILSKTEQRFIEALEKLSRRVAGGKLIDMEKVQRAIGRIQAQHPRVRRYYTIRVNGSFKAETVTWSRNDHQYKKLEDLYGCYVLRTDMQDLTKEQLWNLYMTLTRAEDGFQSLKRDLGLRPNRHQIEKRGDGHVFITVLAYQLLCFIQRTLERSGDHRDWESIRRILQTHCYTTIILPTKNGRTYHIRKPGQPEQCQAAIYAKLNIDLKNLPIMRTQYEKKN